MFCTLSSGKKACLAVLSPGKLPDPVRYQIWYKCTGSGTSNPTMHQTDPNYFKFLTDKLKGNFEFC